ncbi:LppP/LprE family lipoprotein [Nocardia panacis]|uniref:LppP/LprE family lipoprotein n=1 Tax=Nocardia panacis TaxID=2340916 RepID=A0A3A4JWR4_9NOCA|nr:LppP/LprE family lipoprotein [Nocardia panacis]RJO74999.1 LppP/LprE family lipoprotein [Nocardia panacis]
MNKIIGATVTAIGLALATTGCQNSEPAIPRSAPVSSAHITPAPGIAQAPASDSLDRPIASQAPSADAPATAGHGFCVDANNEVVHRAIQSLGSTVFGDPYDYLWASDAHIGSCPQLLWVVVKPPNSVASSPAHVLFFNHDGYIGTATAKATGYTRVPSSADRTVDVEYHWPSGCCDIGSATITFTLGADGRTITHSPEIPKEVVTY